MNSKKTIYVATLILGVGALAWAKRDLIVKSGGRTLPGEAIQVKSKVYISAESLRAIGISVSLSGSTVTLNPRPALAPADGEPAQLERPKRVLDAEGGANEQKAVEGQAGEWLFNGIFRFKVHSIERVDEDESHRGWKVKIEVRNGTAFNNYAPGGVGYEGMQLVLKDGESVNFSEFGEPEGDFLTPGLAQGAQRTGTAIFYTNLSATPVKLIFRVNPEGDDNISPKFTVPDPSFRVDLRRIVPKR
jgi:hypothetical protein